MTKASIKITVKQIFIKLEWLTSPLFACFSGKRICCPGQTSYGLTWQGVTKEFCDESRDQQHKFVKLSLRSFSKACWQLARGIISHCNKICREYNWLLQGVSQYVIAVSDEYWWWTALWISCNQLNWTLYTVTLSTIYFMQCNLPSYLNQNDRPMHVNACVQVAQAFGQIGRWGKACLNPCNTLLMLVLMQCKHDHVGKRLYLNHSYMPTCYHGAKFQWGVECVGFIAMATMALFSNIAAVSWLHRLYIVHSVYNT